MTTKFLLDSGDPQEYRNIATLAKQHQSELWGATTNPTLIAKQLNGKKLHKEEAFRLQKDIVLEILSIVPGIVSAEVYADTKTVAESMIEQGREIASWHERIAVKLPTTIAGFAARTQLRKEKILINNTLVFSQQQVFAICLHEELVQQAFGPLNTLCPPFISPFVGRLDDTGYNGMDLISQSMSVKKLFTTDTWILEASVRTPNHFNQGLQLQVDLITAPAKSYTAYFTQKQPTETNLLQPIPEWLIPDDVKNITTLEAFTHALTHNQLDIHHALTDKGIEKFVADWNTILQD